MKKIYAVYVDTTDGVTVSFTKFDVSNNGAIEGYPKIAPREVIKTYDEIEKHFRKEYKLTFTTVMYFPGNCSREAQAYAIKKLAENGIKNKSLVSYVI